MAQFLRPDSDVSAGLWTTAPLWSSLDEATASDADLVTSNNNTNPDTFEVGLSNPGGTPGAGTVTLRVRRSKSATGGHALEERFALYQGATLVQELAQATPDSTAWATVSLNVTSAITDWTDLRVRVSREGGTGGSGATRRSLLVSWIELEAPNAAANTTVTPGVVALTTATFVPTVSVTLNQTVTPGVVALTLATFAPIVTGGAGTTVTPGVASLALTPFAPVVAGRYPATVLVTSGLVSYWRLDETTGTVAADSKGTNTGTYVAAPTLGAATALVGDNGTAVTFNGSTQYITVPDAAALDYGDVFTLEAWVKTTAVVETSLIHKGTGPGALSMTASGFPRISIPGSAHVLQATQAINDGAWHFVVVTKNGSARRVYVDGFDKSPGTPPADATATNNTTALVIGGTPFATQLLSGSVDEVAVYNVALSAATALAHYNAGAGTNHQLVTPTTASLTTATFAPAVTGGAGLTVTPSTASLALSAFAPTVTATAHQTVTPGAASLSTTTFAPTVTAAAGLTLVPGTASLALTAFAPTVAATAHQTVTPGVAALTATRFAPTVTATAHQLVTPGVASLTLATFAPTVTAAAGLTLVPTTASLSTSTFAPTISVTEHRTVTPGVASLSTTAFAPTVTATAHQTITPPTATLVIETFAPTATGGAGVTVTPTTAALTLAAFAPSVPITEHQTVTVNTAVLVLAAFAPTVNVSDHQTVTPDVVALSLTGYAPTVTGSGTIATPGVSALSLTTFAPSLYLTGYRDRTPTDSLDPRPRDWQRHPGSAVDDFR